MISIQFIFIFAMGAAAGWFASQITGCRSRGLASDLTIGIVGAAFATIITPDFVAWGRLPALFLGATFFSVMIFSGIQFFRKLRIEQARGLPERRSRRLSNLDAA